MTRPRKADSFPSCSLSSGPSSLGPALPRLTAAKPDLPPGFGFGGRTDYLIQKPRRDRRRTRKPNGLNRHFGMPAPKTGPVRRTITKSSSIDKPPLRCRPGLIQGRGLFDLNVLRVSH